MASRLCFALSTIVLFLTTIEAAAEPQAGVVCYTKPRLLGVNSGMLLDLNVSTGAGTPISGRGLTGNGWIGALAYDSNSQTLYGVSSSTAELARIDIDSGDATPIGRLGFSNVSSLAFDSQTDTLYGIDRNSQTLLTINTATGQATPIDDSFPHEQIVGLAIDHITSTLYALNSTDELFVYDLSTQVSNYIGDPGLPLGEALTFNQNDRVLYAHESHNEWVVRINPAPFEVTLTGPSEVNSLYGLAYDPKADTLFGSTGETLVTLPKRFPASAVGPLGENFESVNGPALVAKENRFYAIAISYVSFAPQLITIDRLTGAATRLGDIQYLSPPFGVPVGSLAYDTETDTLYGIVDTPGSTTLGIVDRESLELTRVGPLETNADYGLAWNPATRTIYGTGGGNLIAIDRNTGLASVIGPLGYSSFADLAFDPTTNTLYGLRQSTYIEPPTIFTIDTNTGAAEPLGQLQFTEIRSLGIDTSSGIMYGIHARSTTNDTLYAIDPESVDEPTQTVGCFFPGSTDALAYDPNAQLLYGVADDELLRIDVATAIPTVIGPIGFSLVHALAFDPNTGTLYGAANETGVMITIDTATGTGMSVGSIGFHEVSGMAFDPYTDTLYGADQDSNNVIVIDPHTGAGDGLWTLGNDSVESLAFDTNSGQLLYEGNDALWSLDPATGSITNLGFLAFDEINGMTFIPSTGALLATDDQIGLVEMNLETAQGKTVGSLGFRDIGGLAYDSTRGVVFCGHRESGQLYRINPLDGTATPVGSPSWSYNCLKGLAYDPDADVLYGLCSRTLSMRDPVSGEETIIGEISGPDFPRFAALAFDAASGTLFAAQDFHSDMWAINPKTADAAFVGWVGLLRGLAFDDATQSLYGIRSGGLLIAIDPATAETLEIGLSGFNGMAGLAFIPATVCGDLNLDGLVTLADYTVFQDCFTGPGVIAHPGCRAADFDSDHDIDLHDWSGLQRAFTTP